MGRKIWQIVEDLNIGNATVELDEKEYIIIEADKFDSCIDELNEISDKTEVDEEELKKI